MMNKKVILALTLVLVLGVGAGMGTMALYSKQFETNSNQVASATFEPALDSVQEINVDGKFYPGETQIIYLDYDNSKSQVDTVFSVVDTTVTIGGVEYSPILVGEVEDVTVNAGETGSAELTVTWNKTSGTELFDHDNNEDTAEVNDTTFAGKTLKVDVNVKATQVQ